MSRRVNNADILGALGFLPPNPSTVVLKAILNVVTATQTQSPITQPTIDTLAALIRSYTTTGDHNTFEFPFQWRMLVNTGLIPAGTAWGAVSGRGGDAKVLRFAELILGVNGGTSWIDNEVGIISSGATGSFIGNELDINNDGYHAGDAAGVAGIYPSLASPPDNTTHPAVVIGNLITGAGNFRTTTAYMISGVRFDANTGTAYGDAHNRGYTSQGGPLQHDFGTYNGSSLRAFYDTGSHTLGLDLQSSTNSAAAVALKAPTSNGDNSGLIAWVSPTPAIVGSMRCSSTGVMTLAPASNLQVGGGALLPVVDNVTVLGNSTNRWAQIWVSDSTIHTSDAAAKTDINEVTPEHAAQFFAELTPVSYRVAETNDLVPTDVVQQHPEVDAEGKPVIDYVAAQHDDGTPVLHPVKLRSTVLGASGQPIVTTRMVPLMHARQRLKPVTVSELRPQSRPGKRLHTGVLAGDVAKAGVAAFGDTTGAYVSPGDGPDGVRHDQMWGPAVALLKHHMAVIADQQKRIAALEAKLAGNG